MGSNFDTVLYVRADRCDSDRAEVVCNDDFIGVQSRVSLMAQPGTSYFVVVDSYNASGHFVLNLREGPCL